MRDNDKAPLTMEERLALAARSQASSPETAAKLVERLSKIPTTTLFAEHADLELMYHLIGVYWDLPEEDPLHYSGFCRSFRMALEADFVSPVNLPWRTESLRPVLGGRVNNAIVLLGLMLLDHVKGRLRDKTIYHCTRMTLGQYLDALETLAFPEEDTLPAQRFRTWRDASLRRHDRSAPLGDVLADILRGYIAGWHEFDHLDHILRCTSALACYLEDVAEELPQEEVERVRQFRETLRCRYDPELEGWAPLETDKRHSDPGGYFFCLANEYLDNVPDLGGKDTPARAIRSQIFLPRRDYDLEVLHALADLSPSPDLGALLKKYGDPKRLTAAMAKIDIAALDLHMLWIEPYLRMEERRGKEKPETQAPLG